ncbi:MAG: hypothetical protein ABI647_05660 [Gemmatimonadota bacterium]
MTATETMSAEASIASLATELRHLIDSGRADDALRRSEGLDPGLKESPEIELESARALARTGHLERATARATTALWGFRVKRDVRGQMRANLVMGGIAFEQGYPHAAEHHYGVVRVLATALDDRQVQSKVTNNLACLALQRGDFDAAEALLQSALNLAKDLADLRAQAETFHNLNITYRSLGQFEAGSKAAQEAVTLAEGLEDWSMVALALGGLAETGAWLDLGEHQDLLLDRGQAAALRAGDRLREAGIGRVRAVLALRRKDNAKAYEFAAMARKLAEAVPADVPIGECTAIMAIASKRQGQIAEANHLRDEAITLLTRMKAYLETEWLEREWGAF